MKGSILFIYIPSAFRRGDFFVKIFWGKQEVKNMSPSERISTDHEESTISEMTSLTEPSFPDRVCSIADSVLLEMGHHEYARLLQPSMNMQNHGGGKVLNQKGNGSPDH